jgi:hypothetical protein
MRYYSLYRVKLCTVDVGYLDFEFPEVSWHLPHFSLLVMATPGNAHVRYTLLALRALIQPREGKILEY